MAAAITIDNIFPWGRSLDEYRHMFALNDPDLDLNILDCAGGPASFNAEMHQQGRRVISCDPLYQFDAAAIRSRVAETAEKMICHVRQDAHRFVWDRIQSPEHMAELRLSSMETFLADYELGRKDARYVTAKLPALPFADKPFDLAVCSHFLFLYSHELTLDFHFAAIGEMTRLSNEVRIFPLLDMAGKRTEFVTAVVEEFNMQDFSMTIETVDYEFQRGGNEMMRIKRR